MDALLGDKYHRRWFFAASVATLGILLLLRFVALPLLWGIPKEPASTILISLLDTFITALIATLLVTLLALWLIPQARQMAKMEVVEPFEIKTALGQAHEDTDEWWYRGHSGRHFRAVTLPRLAAEARESNTTKRIFLQILDPTLPATCEYYSRFRGRLRSAKKDLPWTLERVQCELLATIAAAYSWRAKEPGLQLKLGLIDTTSLFRVDLSSRLAIITKEDPREPALRCDAGTFFYRAYKEDLLMSMDQARELPQAVTTVGPDQLSTEDIKRLFRDLKIDSPSISENTLAVVQELVRSPENPYE